MIGVADSGPLHYLIKGLQACFVTGRKQGVQAKHADRLRMLLGRLYASTDPRDMNLPGVDLPELKGMRKRITTGLR